MPQGRAHQVLQVTAALQEGGVEQGTIDLALFLKEKNWQPWVASAGGQKTVALHAANIPHKKLPLHRKNPFTLLWNAWNIYRLLTQNQFQLVHARSRAPAWAAWLACVIYNKTHVHTPVVFLTSWHGTHKVGGRFKRFYNSVMLRGKKVITISRFLQQHIQENYPTDQKELIIIPRGADSQKFYPQATPSKTLEHLHTEFNLPANTPILLLIGRLTRWKGQLLALQALSTLMDEPWVLLLAGGADKKQLYLKEIQIFIREHHMEERVRLLGSRTDTAALYNLADIALSTSTEPEAFGRVAVEAQMSGTPIIASAHGGSLETIQHEKTGYLVQPNDAQALATCLRHALTAPQNLAKMGHAAHRHARQNFDSRHTCEQEFAVYQDLIMKNN